MIFAFANDPQQPSTTLFPYTTLFRSIASVSTARTSTEYSVQPLTAARWPDMLELARQRGMFAGCWCMWFRRSEEHTSELQSHVNLVCRLLLEKKKRVTLDCDKHIVEM